MKVMCDGCHRFDVYTAMVQVISFGREHFYCAECNEKRLARKAALGIK